jgi:uncharacterized protein
MATVTATPEALDLIAEIVADHGPVLFHQSGGCCDGSSPMCYPKGEFLIGDYDVKLGEIGGAPFYISGPQYEAWKHTDLVIDVVPGRGGMFSLDNGRERRFLVRSEICAVAPPPERYLAVRGFQSSEGSWTAETTIIVGATGNRR